MKGQAEISEKARRVYDEEIQRIADRFLESQGDDFIMDEREDLKLSAIKQNGVAKLFHKDQALYSQITEIAQMNVMQFPSLIHALMLLVGVERDAICETGTNCFVWKKAKLCLDEMTYRMSEFQIQGQKQADFRSF